MLVQLIVADEQRKGQAIPVNLPSFIIGRAEGCNLRSHNPKVSRYHCTIQIDNGVVTVQDLGGENGTFVNGNRISSVHTLKDGDKLAVGTHNFVVSLQAKAERSGTNHNDFFELPPSSTPEDIMSSGDSKTATVLMQLPKKPEQDTETMFEIRLDGQRISVSKSRLFDLARKGSVLPDDLVTVAGTKVFADSIQGIVFGDKASVQPPPSDASSMNSASQKPVAAAAESDPFAFPDLGNSGSNSSPFNNDITAPVIRVSRKESTFNALWNALDISFNRVYTMEGNSLVIHSIKALYYIVVVICLLGIIFPFINFCADWYGNGDILGELRRHYVALAVVTLGFTTIIAIVRILLEMLLLAWFESAKQEAQETEEEK